MINREISVLPNLQFGSIEAGICNAHSRGFGFFELQILILDAFELQIQTNRALKVKSEEYFERYMARKKKLCASVSLW